MWQCENDFLISSAHIIAPLLTTLLLKRSNCCKPGFLQRVKQHIHPHNTRLSRHKQLSDVAGVVEWMSRGVEQKRLGSETVTPPTETQWCCEADFLQTLSDTTISKINIRILLARLSKHNGTRRGRRAVRGDFTIRQTYKYRDQDSEGKNTFDLLKRSWHLCRPCLFRGIKRRLNWRYNV